MEIVKKVNDSFKELVPSQAARLALTGVGFVSLIYLKRKIFRGRLLPPAGKAVLVTGCDTELGFGRAIALRLHEIGYVVFAGCLEAQKAGNTLYADFSYSSTFQVIQLDVTKQEQIDAALEHVEKWLKSKSNHRFYGVVNNAGIGSFGPVEWQSLQTFQRVFDVNMFGVVRVTRTFLPLLRLDGDGRVLVISSVAGDVPNPNAAPYCGSKAAILAIFESIRMEVKKFNVKVTAIMPDFYRTNIITDTEVIMRNIDREVAAVSKEVLNAYGGERRVAKLKRAMTDIVPKLAQPDLSPVVNSVVTALGSPNPERRYYPISTLTSVLLFIHTNFPRFGQWLNEKLLPA